MAQLLYDRIYPLHGLPLQIISDRGVQYSAELFQEWCKLLGIESTMSIAYHPQTNGQTEQVNQILEQYLRCYVDYDLKNWSNLLPSTEFAYNNQAHEGTKESPFFLEYGRNPRAVFVILCCYLFSCPYFVLEHLYILVVFCSVDVIFP